MVIVPLHGGSGTRLKIVEAMAMGKAIVSTSIGAEGLACTNGEDIVIADDAPAFAAQVLGLLGDPGRRAELGEKARGLAVRSYAWGVLAGRLDEVYRRMVDGNRENGGVAGEKR